MKEVLNTKISYWVVIVVLAISNIIKEPTLSVIFGNIIGAVFAVLFWWVIYVTIKKFVKYDK